MNVTKNFTAEEFIPQEIYLNKDCSKLLQIGYPLIKLCQEIRTKFGAPLYVNNWASGGPLNLSGYRSPECKLGAWKSQHKQFAAADLHQSIMSQEEFKAFLIGNFDYFKIYGLTRIEANTVGWTHIDMLYTGLDYLYEFN
jgi:hypothetical protein